LPSVCFYISGHGFGHASRQIEIINAFGARRPDIGVVVRTSAPRWLFDRTARVPVTLIPGECDTGVVQRDSLRLDEAETVRRADAFHRLLPAKAAQEAIVLRDADTRLVIADAPPLGCAAAAAAGVPSVVITNFTWDWIYEAYAAHLDDAPALLPTIRAAYGQALAAWRLPMFGQFTAFKTVVDTPFVARHARHSREDVRRTLQLPHDRPLVLSSFGGLGVSGLDHTRLDCLDEYGVVTTHRDMSDVAAQPPPNLFQLTEAGLYDSGLRYEDLVAACEVVATKPGYGIISEAIANDTALLYTSRGNFVEYEVLVREMPRYVRSGFIDHDSLFAGQWRRALDAIRALPAPPERPRTDGAAWIAERLDRSITEGRGP
jgi:L-arabinokinase